MNYELQGKRVLITGAARGIGREMVKGFLEQGAVIVAADRDEVGLMETTSLYKGSVHSFIVDIADEESVLRLMAFAEEKLGGLDVCVNNAAVAPHAALLDERVDVWDKVYAVNCRGTFLMTREAAKLMIGCGCKEGRIVNFSSSAASRGSAGGAAYASSRAAVESFSRCAAIELAQHGILVNVISPGLIDTQVKPLPPHMAQMLGARIPTLPLARPGEPSEVVELTMFLSSKACSYMSGCVYSVDGGASVGSRFSGTVVDDDIRYDWLTGVKR